MLEQWKASEFTAANLNPLAELHYGLDDKSPLQKYNSITPTIRVALQVQTNWTKEEEIADYKLYIEMLEQTIIDYNISISCIPYLRRIL